MKIKKDEDTPYWAVKSRKRKYVYHFKCVYTDT